MLTIIATKEARKVSMCPGCGKTAPEGSRFCPFCGAKLPEMVRQEKDALVGKRIADRYVVKELLGSGAMGSIYKAEHHGLHKDVVVKVLHPHLTGDISHIKRFHREAKAASRLSHPNCITVIDYGQTSDGHLFIVMEYVPGKDLCRVLFEEGKLEPLRVAEISLQALDALAEAHAQGVIHRDLKPENIMLERLRTGREHVKVLDFGIAKMRDLDGVDPSPGFKTKTGMVFGTPEYMSPEQIRGDELDGRTDLYSLGVVMYHMLTGDIPFTGESVLEVATRQLTEPPKPILEVRPDCPKELAGFVDRMLEKDRDKRFASAQEAREALAEVLEELHGRKRQEMADFAKTTVRIEGPPPQMLSSDVGHDDGEEPRSAAGTDPPAAPEPHALAAASRWPAWVVVLVGVLVAGVCVAGAYLAYSVLH